MTDSDIEILRKEMREGFKGMNHRVDSLSQKIDGLHQRMDGLNQRLDGMQETMDDVRFGLHSIMNKLLAPAETNEIRSRMRPDAPSTVD